MKLRRWLNHQKTHFWSKIQKMTLLHLSYLSGKPIRIILRTGVRQIILKNSLCHFWSINIGSFEWYYKEIWDQNSCENHWYIMALVLQRRTWFEWQKRIFLWFGIEYYAVLRFFLHWKHLHVDSIKGIVFLSLLNLHRHHLDLYIQKL